MSKIRKDAPPPIVSVPSKVIGNLNYTVRESEASEMYVTVSAELNNYAASCIDMDKDVFADICRLYLESIGQL